MRVGRARQWEGFCHDRMEPPRADLAKKKRHRLGERTPFVPQVTEVQPEHTAIPVHQRQRLEPGIRAIVVRARQMLRRSPGAMLDTP